ncbi:type VI secretion system Vgr family protein [Spirosoma fluviale]|uniref:Phage late control gene D protein (GPD) n=1 Tax=Spirosoma fluviale TaxID=1597977 RepID=A0A286G4B7_9BACT|nr:contractile injection system protein, VgrG/Pvc8 family [Spirosoma fluviale]SOD90066.1 Phage late control gene D protein (GPD) [Spirosoma fluviale]
MPVYTTDVKTTLLIDGKIIPTFHSITLQQSIHTTHEFRVVFEHDAVENLVTLFSDQLDKLNRKSIELTVNGAREVPPLEFKGVITQTELKQQDDGYWGQMIVTGHGHCESLLTLPGTETFIDKSITDIVNQCLSNYSQPKKVAGSAKPAQLPFCVRYSESVWHFMKRLAYDFGAWFYYDGTVLHFTTSPGTTSQLNLTFGANLTQFRTGVRAVPSYVKQYDYLAEENRRLESETTQDKAPYGKPKTSGVITPHPAQTTADMPNYRDNQRAVLTAEEKYMEGQATIPGLFPGCKVIVKDSPAGQGGQSVPYLVTDVVHYISGVGEYRNRFRAIPADVAAMPMRKLVRPLAQTQIGEVTDNKDPKGMGRVKVKLLWMSGSETTPFIRMTQPHFGSYTDNKKTRGFQFVPAIGDQVMVGFEYNNPERPFVIGAIPHGKNSAIDTSKPEEEKHISVGSGSTLTFIEKPSVKEIHLQVDEKNFIKISVPSGGGDITINSSKNIVVKATAKVTIEAPEIVLSGTTITLDAKQAVNIKGAQVKVEATAQMNIKGAMTDVEGSGTLNVKSSGMTAIKGSMVMIN